MGLGSMSPYSVRITSTAGAMKTFSAFAFLFGQVSTAGLDSHYAAM
jgi:hypothetical protein